MIRKLKAEDKALYLKMAHDFYNSPAVLHPIPDSYIERTFEECMNGGIYASAYILEYEGKAVGYGLTAKTYSQEAGGYVYWLEELYIKEEYRSKGLGSEFFTYLEQNKEAAVTRFRLEVEADNKRAAELYTRLGYQDLGYCQMMKEFPQ